MFAYLKHVPWLRTVVLMPGILHSEGVLQVPVHMALIGFPVELIEANAAMLAAFALAMDGVNDGVVTS